MPILFSYIHWENQIADRKIDVFFLNERNTQKSRKYFLCDLAYSPFLVGILKSICTQPDYFII